MRLSSYVRVWLEGGKGPRIKEASDYVKFLESEIKRLNHEAKMPRLQENRDYLKRG